MSTQHTPIIRPEEPEASGKSFELTLGDNSVVLPEDCRNSISVLIEEAKTEEKSYDDIEKVTQGLYQPDPLYPDAGRFLHVHPAYNGLGSEGSFVKNRPGLYFNDPDHGANGSLLVFPKNPEYIIFDMMIEPGEEYTDYHLGKRDKEGRGYVICNLETQDFDEAIKKAQDAIDNGHTDPIPLPKDENDITDIKFPAGFTGEMKLDPLCDATGFQLESGWTCDVFSAKGKKVASLHFREEPLGIVRLVNDADHFKTSVSKAIERAKEAEKQFTKDVPF